MYEDKTPDSIKAAIIEQMLSDLDTREGSFVDDMLGPTALELSKVYGSLNAVRPMVWVDETSGEYLDYAADDLGIEPRKAGTRAQAELRITGTPGHTVPAGTAFLTVSNEYFDTQRAVTIPVSGEALVAAQSREVGARYNVEAEAICYQFANSDRITAVTNPEPAIGGSDVESDASLYARIVLARQRPSTSGNVYDYERWALEVSGVGAVRVLPLWDGPGTVKLLIADEYRQPVDEAIVANCAAHIEEVRPIGPEITVLSALAMPVDVAATVHATGSATQEDIAERLREELTEYFAGLAMEQTEVRYNRVGAILMGVEGVLDYVTLTLNGEQANLPLEDDQVPTVGEVVVVCV